MTKTLTETQYHLLVDAVRRMNTAWFHSDAELMAAAAEDATEALRAIGETPEEDSWDEEE